MANEPKPNSSSSSNPDLLLDHLVSSLDAYYTPTKPKATTFLTPHSIPTTTTTTVPEFERGPRYNLYSQIRESRIRSRMAKSQTQSHIPTSQFSYPAKSETESQIPRFQFSSPVKQFSSDYSGLGQFNFDSTTTTPRKENRRPPAENRMVVGSEKCFTPPPSLPKPSRVLGTGGSHIGGGKGSQSVGVPSEKKGLMGSMGRKSCASYEDLMSLGGTVARETRVFGRGGGRGGGSQSVGGVGMEKKGLMSRKSYACLEDIKGISASGGGGCGGAGGGGSQTVNVGGGERRGLLSQGRKSYASLEELRGLSSAAASTIAEESSRVGVGGGRIGKMLEGLKAATVGKKGGVGVVRKSYASFEEIKGLSATERTIGRGRNGVPSSGRTGVASGNRTPGRDAVLGYRHW